MYKTIYSCKRLKTKLTQLNIFLFSLPFRCISCANVLDGLSLLCVWKVYARRVGHFAKPCNGCKYVLSGNSYLQIGLPSWCLEKEVTFFISIFYYKSLIISEYDTLIDNKLFLFFFDHKSSWVEHYWLSWSLRFKIIWRLCLLLSV